MFCVVIKLILVEASVLCCHQVDMVKASVLCCDQFDSGGGKCFVLSSS